MIPLRTNQNLGREFSAKNKPGKFMRGFRKMKDPAWFAIRSFLQLLGIVGCDHIWSRTNLADERDVPDCYPPNKPLDYVSPRRRCVMCDRREWLVGPEVCGGSKARWVEIPAVVGPCLEGDYDDADFDKVEARRP